MARKVAVSNLNASTLDILNVIRANASAEYQSLVPAVTQANEIPKVGEIICGYPALANQFIAALVNRIALVRVTSKTYNNPYRDLKKGMINYGETIEEVFVNIAKAREFSAEKAEAREFKRTIPDVRAAFHVMNWRVQYPVTIQDEDLARAFTSADGVTDLIARIVDSVYTAAEYDEYLLFKYMLIKGIAHGQMYPKSIGDGTDPKDAAVAFRGTSNSLTFMSTLYNNSGVHTFTPKEDQYIFMDANYNASYDVNVLASAFNMDKADFMGRLRLIDDWTTFDNDRFDVIRAASDGIEEVTAAELALMANVKAVIVDGEWFQIYDNLKKFTETYVASGLYWNYFYNDWKTISYSPFSNAIVFVTDDATITNPASITATVDSVSVGDNATVVTLNTDGSAGIVNGSYVQFVQNQDNTTKGVAVHRYGAYIFPDGVTTTTVTAEFNGDTYSAAAITPGASVGDTITLAKNS